jgi:hypothetical protein
LFIVPFLEALFLENLFFGSSMAMVWWYFLLLSSSSLWGVLFIFYFCLIVFILDGSTRSWHYDFVEAWCNLIMFGMTLIYILHLRNTIKEEIREAPSSIILE